MSDAIPDEIMKVATAVCQEMFHMAPAYPEQFECLDIVARALMAADDAATKRERERWETGEKASYVEISDEAAGVIHRLPPLPSGKSHLFMRNVMSGLVYRGPEAAAAILKGEA